MQGNEPVRQRNRDIVRKILPVASIVVALLILYYYYPASFDSTWKGRTYYLFFAWLILLETILGWDELKTKRWKLASARGGLVALALTLPTLYVIGSQTLGWNAQIVEQARLYTAGDYWANFMPLSVEYLVFAALFALILVLEYGVSNLRAYSISIVFLGLIGMVYITDNLYPEGKFTPFQFIVPTTATIAANVLRYMGQQILWLGIIRGMPILLPVDAQGRSLPGVGPFGIAWPCAGVDSLLVYSVTILVFLKKSGIPLWQKATYFGIGAVITYFINIYRVVTILQIAINLGNWQRFHDYYGQMYSITWIMLYPMLIIGIRMLTGKIRGSKTDIKYSPEPLNITPKKG